jgi:hypothetical protein
MLIPNPFCGPTEAPSWGRTTAPNEPNRRVQMNSTAGANELDLGAGRTETAGANELGGRCRTNRIEVWIAIHRD